jgi:hypothetical protein
MPTEDWMDEMRMRGEERNSSSTTDIVSFLHIGAVSCSFEREIII